MFAYNNKKCIFLTYEEIGCEQWTETKLCLYHTQRHIPFTVDECKKDNAVFPVLPEDTVCSLETPGTEPPSL